MRQPNTINPPEIFTMAVVTYALTPTKADFAANNYTPVTQVNPDVLALPNGGFAVAYITYLGGPDNNFILVNFYNAEHNDIGYAGLPYSGGSEAVGEPSLTLLGNGNVLVVWIDDETVAPDIRGAIYSPEGVLISADIDLTQLGVASAPSDLDVTALAGGGFVLTCTLFDDVYFSRYTDNGTQIGTAFNPVNTTVTGTQRDAQVLALAGGGFVVTWTDLTNGSDLFARLFNAFGVATSGEFLVDTNSASQPSMAALPNGGWVVAYADGSYSGLPANEITLKFFSASGVNTTPGGFIRASTGSIDGEVAPDVTVLDNGFVLVSWTYPSVGGADNDIRGALFDGSGNRVLVGGQPDFGMALGVDQEIASSVAALNGGEFITAWQDGGTTDIQARISEVVRTTVGDGTAESLTGDALRDSLQGAGGNDLLDGGAGFDTAVYSGTQGGYSFSKVGGNIVVTDTNVFNGNNGADQLIDIEAAQFSNGTVRIGSVGEFRVNTYTASSQGNPATTALSNGGFLITWVSDSQDGSNLGVYAQRYDATGVAQGAEFRVNTSTLGYQGGPSITALSNGGFVATWSARGQDGSSLGVYAQRYGATGLTQGVEFRVNTYTTDTQSSPSTTALSNGGFVVTWQSSLQDGSPVSVYAQRYDAVGVAQGAEFRVNTYATAGQFFPDIAALNNGGFVVTWNSELQDGSEYGVYAQRYNAAGVAQGAEFKVNTNTASTQFDPTITALSNGGFVVTWESNLQDGSGYGVYAQRYNAAGVAQGAEFRVNTYTANIQVNPDITALSNGGFVVTWNSFLQDGSDYGVYAQRYDAAGVAQGAEFRVNSFTTNSQGSPSITALSDGGFVVTWESDLQDGSNLGIYAQRYDAAGNAVAATLTGDAAANTITWTGAQTVMIDGGLGTDILTGGTGNDQLQGGADADRIYGGAGVDTAVFSGLKSGYTITKSAGNVTVSGADGVDVLKGVEKLTFTDKSIFVKLAVSDFNADANSDLLWFRQSDGYAYLWTLNNNVQSGGNAMGQIGAAWTIQTTGDFNGDGSSDFIWKNTTTGQFYIWNFTNGIQSGGSNIGVIGTNWNVMGSGDFNADGTGDIVWRDSNTGQLYLWMMQNNAIASSTNLGSIGVDWTVQAVGDFNGDGTSDLALRNTATGQAYLWNFTNGALSGGNNLGNIPTTWQIMGSGDFNADGTDDLAWRNSADGKLILWMMQNNSISSTSDLGTIGAQWTIDAISDVNADGTSDLLLKNTSSGQFYIWDITNGVVSGGADLGLIGADWQLV
jgi:hypothetical protein